MSRILNFYDFVLNEAKANYKAVLFIRDMKLLGFKSNDIKDGAGFVKEIIDKNGKKHKLHQNTHFHNNEGGKCVDPNAIKDVVKLLKQEYDLTGDITSIDLAPWDAWGVKKPKIEDPLENVESEKEEELDTDSIAWANNRYNKVELEPLSNYVYNADKDICIMKKNEKGSVKYNICRSSSDRRPMHKIWFDEEYKEDNHPKLPTKYGLAIYAKTKKEQKEFMYTVYPILPNGTLGKLFKESKEIDNLKTIINE